MTGIRSCILLLFLWSLISEYSRLNTVEYCNTVNTCMGRRIFRTLFQNLGHGSSRNKLTQIEHLLQIHRPHVLYIGESRVDKNVKNLLQNVHKYNVEDLGPNGRLWAIIDKSVSYERLKEYEDPNISAIWLKIGTKEHFISCGYYREWKLLHDPNSKSTKN